MAQRWRRRDGSRERRAGQVSLEARGVGGAVAGWGRGGVEPPQTTPSGGQGNKALGRCCGHPGPVRAGVDLELS